MARTYGVEFPERPLMSMISDVLGIEHFTTSRGSTVRRDFLEAVCRALGVGSEDLDGRHKDGLLRLAVEASTGEPMSAELLSPGETVTNDALQVILDGVMRGLALGRLDWLRPPLDEPAGDGAEPILVERERKRRLQEQVIREGQGRFRVRLLEAYGNRCSVTGTDAAQALDAAHIVPVSSKGSDSTQNGLLLRTDLHRLFDAGALAVDDEFRLIVAPYLLPTTYGDLVGQPLRLPKRLVDRPSLAALQTHRAAAAL